MSSKQRCLASIEILESRLLDAKDQKEKKLILLIINKRLTWVMQS